LSQSPSLSQFAATTVWKFFLFRHWSKKKKKKVPFTLTMLDIQLLLEDKGGNPELIRESQRRRGGNVEIVDEIIALYKDWTTSRCFLFI
jgi:hypothetical protein